MAKPSPESAAHSASSAPLMLSVSGCRGLVGSSLTPEIVARFAGGLGAWIHETSPVKKGRPAVVLGRDGRAGATAVEHAAIAGLTGAGCDVLHAGITMTPTIGVAVDALKAAAGLVLTASHNPQEWNGLKPVVRIPDERARPGQASAPNKAIADDLIARFRSGAVRTATWNGTGSVRSVEEEAYKAHGGLVLTRLAEMGINKLITKRKFAVSLDCVNGAGRILTPLALEALSCRVTVSGEEETGLFPHTPEPTRTNLAGFARTVKKAKSAVGFAQDPDADRLALIDEKGRYIGEEYTLVLAARALFEFGVLGKGSVIAVNLSTSRMIEDVAARYGARVVRSAVGEANVVEAMRMHGCEFGGEGNGGVIWPAVTSIRDSLGAMTLILGLMARTKKSVSELAAEVPAYAIVKHKVDLPRKEDATPILERAQSHYSGQGHRVDTQDGVRVEFAKGDLAERAWLHIRASNTEPILRLIAEAPTQEGAEGVLKEMGGMV